MEDYQLLEERFQKWVGVPLHMVAVSSGTSALHLALESLGLPLGSKVLVPAFSMYACARAVVMAGHVPVFIDCDETLNLDWKLLKYRTSNSLSEIKAVLAVANYGRRVSCLEQLHTFAREFDWKVVEDLAEAHGVDPHEDTDAACWSFYRNKIVAGEEGGMVGFRDPAKANLCRQLRSLGFTEAHDFNHIPRGVNARLSNAHARPILDSLASVRRNLAKRRQVEAWYDKAIPEEYKMPTRNVVWVYDVRIRGCDATRLNTVVAYLQGKGIAARHSFKPNSYQEEFRTGLAVGRSEEACRAATEVLYLPVSPHLPEEEVYWIAKEFLTALKES
jgi:perosamine synthetase